MQQYSGFRTSRISATTFLVEEVNDFYYEEPYIYVKIAPGTDTILVIDSGCGGKPKPPETKVHSLRQYLETVDVEANGNKPLNPGGKLSYVVVTTHCHFDHILAVEQFQDATILASSNDPTFLAEDKLSEHSLCNDMDIPTPNYKPILVPHHHQIRSPVNNQPLGVEVLHTPGHTPDELALYDETERMLYVGDTVYEDTAIIFPKEGSIIEWYASMNMLAALVVSEEAKGSGDVSINAGHSTSLRPARIVLQSSISFMDDVVAGKEPVKDRFERRGETNVHYGPGNGRLSLRCPERLVDEARNASSK